MNHSQIRAFHAVAREGGFSAAARHLGLTQPAITLQVKALERHYGVSLFHRRGRGVILTDAGEQLRLLTNRMAALDDEADELLSAVGALRRGRLKVGADGPHHVIEILTAYRQRLPAVRVTVAIDNSEILRRDILAFESDIAVLAGRADDPELFHLPFRAQPLVLFAARSHTLAKRRTLSLADLDGQAMVLRETGSATRRLFEEALRAAGAEVDVILEIGSREGVHEAVAAGLGVGVVAASELGADSRIRAVPIADPGLESWEYVVCRRERQTSPFIAVFLEVTAELAQASV